MREGECEMQNERGKGCAHLASMVNGSCGDAEQPRVGVNAGESGRLNEAGSNELDGAACVSHWSTRTSAPSTAYSSNASGGVGRAMLPSRSPSPPTKPLSSGDKANAKSKYEGCAGSSAGGSQRPEVEAAPSGPSSQVMDAERKSDHASEAAGVGTWKPKSKGVDVVKGDRTCEVGVVESSPASTLPIESGGKSTEGVVAPEEATLAGGVGGKTVFACDFRSLGFLREVEG